jgi:hypothetical protein
MPSNNGFNADQKIAERERKVHTIGGRKAKQARRTNEVMRGYRNLLRRQAALEREQAKLDGLSDLTLETLIELAAENGVAEPEIEPGQSRRALLLNLLRDNDICAPGVLLEDIEPRRDELEEESDKVGFELIAIWLKPVKEDEPVDAAWIAEHLDLEDMPGLLRQVSPGAAAVEPDPTPETTPTSS